MTTPEQKIYDLLEELHDAKKRTGLFGISSTREELKGYSWKALKHVFCELRGKETSLEKRMSIAQAIFEKEPNRTGRLLIEELQHSEKDYAGGFEWVGLLKSLDSTNFPLKGIEILLDLLWRELSSKSPHKRFCQNIFSAVEKHRGGGRQKKTLQFLFLYAFLEVEPWSSRAIRLMGAWGGIEHVEKLCLLPISSEEARKALQEAALEIAERPVVVSRLSPNNFEFLIAALFEKKGWGEVEQTRTVKDGGIDIIGKERDRLLLVECKRYQNSSQLKLAHLMDFEQSVRKFLFEEKPVNVQVELWFVTTTSNFDPSIFHWLEEQKHRDWSFHLLYGERLIEELNRYFNQSRYILQVGHIL